MNAKAFGSFSTFNTIGLTTNMFRGVEYMKFRKDVATVITLLCMSWLLAACEAEGTVSSAKGPSTQASQSTQTQEGELELLEYSWETDEIGMKYLGGVVANNTKYTQTKVGILFSIYDADGLKIGEAADVTDSLRPGEKWEIRAICECFYVVDESAETAELDFVIGFPE